MKKLKVFSIALTTFFIYLLHLPLGFARSVGRSKWLHEPFKKEGLVSATVHTVLNANAKSLYDSLHLDLAGLNRKAYEFARRGFMNLVSQGKIINDSILSIVDFSQPSNNKRLYVLDMKNFKILFNTLVAHGKNSGREWANSFSNAPRSFKSSLGFYATREPYEGKKGYSLKLVGLEPGINDKAYQRAIVLHGANYVSQSYIDDMGYIGRSEGCPAIPVHDAEPVIDLIKDGSCLFIYSPSPGYTRHSALIKN
ncbi:MAG: murein L,D-transpeptidase catalytic domain family protein [Chitinophagaceae bacterium]|nr:murein L,D-transpeptidase catalytic domain family protein [Chitinophagaceae bacterium]OQY95089.1 MAG: hypothetical protein B6D37_06880 [Sphingobacteriales bacterium UTBCD1]